MKRTNVFLAEEDRAAIENIQSRYGLATSSDAIRFALRIVARAELQVNDRQLKLAAGGDNSASHGQSRYGLSTSGALPGSILLSKAQPGRR